MVPPYSTKLCISINILYVYFVYVITNEMQDIRKTNEPHVSRRFHISWILTIQSVELTADDVFYKKKWKKCYKDVPAVSTTVSGWYFEFSWYLGLSLQVTIKTNLTSVLMVLYSIRDIYIRSIYIIYIYVVYVTEFYVRGKDNTRIYVRLLLQLFCSIQQKTLYPPPSTPRTKRHLMCIVGENKFVAKSGIYILYAQHAPKS